MGAVDQAPDRWLVVLSRSANSYHRQKGARQSQMRLPDAFECPVASRLASYSPICFGSTAAYRLE